MVRYGIDPVEIKNYIIFKYGVGGGDFLCARSLIENYILTNCKKIKLIAVAGIWVGWQIPMLIFHGKNAHRQKCWLQL